MSATRETFAASEAELEARDFKEGKKIQDMRKAELNRIIATCSARRARESSTMEENDADFERIIEAEEELYQLSDIRINAIRDGYPLYDSDDDSLTVTQRKELDLQNKRSSILRRNARIESYRNTVAIGRKAREAREQERT